MALPLFYFSPFAISSTFYKTKTDGRHPASSPPPPPLYVAWCGFYSIRFTRCSFRSMSQIRMSSTITMPNELSRFSRPSFTYCHDQRITPTQVEKRMTVISIATLLTQLCRHTHVCGWGNDLARTFATVSLRLSSKTADLQNGHNFFFVWLSQFSISHTKDTEKSCTNTLTNTQTQASTMNFALERNSFKRSPLLVRQ